MTDDNYRTIIKFQQEQYENMLMGRIPIVTKKETVALKPCPFCGSYDIQSSYGQIGPNKTGYTILCRDCGMYTDSSDEETAIREWNRRVKE